MGEKNKKELDYDKSNLALENLKNIQEMIRHIDQKVYLTLVVYGFLITIYLEEAKTLIFKNPFSFLGIKCFMSLMTFASGLFFCVSIIIQIYFILFKIICSRNAKNYKEKESNCLFYFEHIKKMGKQKFLKKFKNSEIKLLDDILTQIYEVSCIFEKKSRNYNKLLKYIFLSIVSLIIFSVFSKLL